MSQATSAAITISKVLLTEQIAWVQGDLLLQGMCRETEKCSRQCTGLQPLSTINHSLISVSYTSHFVGAVLLAVLAKRHACATTARWRMLERG